MSKYVGWIDGKALDFRFKKFGENKYQFFLGGYSIAQLWKTDKGWLTIVDGRLCHPLVPRMVEGFKTRTDAIEYLLKVHQLTSKTYNYDAYKYMEDQERTDRIIKEYGGEN